MSKQLAASPSYMRYIALHGMPLGIDPFKNGEVLVLGETKCRYEDYGEICGLTIAGRIKKQLKSSGSLSNHVKKYHPIMLGKASMTGNPTMERIQAAKRWYKEVMDEHDANTLTTLAEPVRCPPSLRNRQSKDKSKDKDKDKDKDKETTGSEQVEIPISNLRLAIPTYKSSNKKAGFKKGDINYNAMAKLLKDAGGEIPCGHCAPGSKCKWTENCISTQWFIYSDEEDDEEEESDG